MKQTQGMTLDDVIRRIVQILPKYGVVRAGIFGSYARGDNTETSDVDILVEFAPGTRLGFEFMGMGLELEECLGRRVDVIFYDNIHPLLRKRILAEEVRVLDETNK